METLAKWNDGLSVEVTAIDNQHKKLLDIINELYNAMMTGQGKEIMKEILDRMAQYTVDHFKTEETYMKKFNFDGYSVHKSEHDDFVAKVTQFMQDFDRGKLLLSIEVMKFLNDWVVNHIVGTDKKYMPIFKENGLS